MVCVVYVHGDADVVMSVVCWLRAALLLFHFHIVLHLDESIQFTLFIRIIDSGDGCCVCVRMCNVTFTFGCAAVAFRSLFFVPFSLHTNWLYDYSIIYVCCVRKHIWYSMYVILYLDLFSVCIRLILLGVCCFFSSSSSSLPSIYDALHIRRYLRLFSNSRNLVVELPIRKCVGMQRGPFILCKALHTLAHVKTHALA